MGLDGCGKFVKYTMFVANFLILLGGITVLAVGIWSCVEGEQSYQTLAGNDLIVSATYILIATGCIVIVISFIGCFGAFKENKCLLLTYFLILLIIFVIMLVGGILGYVYREEVKDKMREKLKTSITKDYEKLEYVRKAWDYVQRERKCCGTKVKKEDKSYTIWVGLERFAEADGSKPQIPESCCNPKHEKAKSECAKNAAAYSYQTDCYDALLDYIMGHAAIVGGVGIGIACVLILGMVFALILFKMIE